MNRFAGLILVIAALVPRFAECQVCVKQISVPEYAPIARAARVTGDVSLKISIGAHGEVVSVEGSGLANVEGSGPTRMLIDMAKESVRAWVFCAPWISEVRVCNLDISIVWKAPLFIRKQSPK